ncbi:MAG TPA: pseudouridine synthase [Candidatus Limnocylindria bacterium]|nr:pseudouridine synthase [Candidatus Limnocylindria bacterium]
MPTDRLNRYLSRAAGVSRRTADEMIRMGRVTVGNKPMLDPGTLLDPSRGEVRIDGTLLLDVPEEKIYLMAHKPDSVVSTMKDKEGRKTAGSLVGEISSRVFPVGRLDYHTTGLLLFTNDGDFAYRFTHPKFGVEKTYIAKVKGIPTQGKLGVLRRGLPIDGVMTNPAKVNFLEAREGKAWISIRIAEGRHHQVRKMFEAIGHRVMKLRRVAIGPQELLNVEPGDWRYLTGKEVRTLFTYVEQKEREAAHAPKPKRTVTSAPPRERKGPRQPKPEWKRPPKGIPKGPGSPSGTRPRKQRRPPSLDRNK